MVVPVLPHEVKARWDYFTVSRTQLPVLCVYVEGATCRDNDLECSGRAHDLWLDLDYSSHNAEKKLSKACQY